MVDPDQTPPITAELPDLGEQPPIDRIESLVIQQGVRTIDPTEPAGDAHPEDRAEEVLMVADTRCPDGEALHLAVTPADASPSCFQVGSGFKPKAFQYREAAHERFMPNGENLYRHGIGFKQTWQWV